jgi:adenosylcobinamide-GDP ribazoletransferase
LIKDIDSRLRSMIDEIKGLVAFMTRIPVGHFRSNFEDMARYFMILPLIGTLVGIFGALVAFVFNYFNFEASNVVGVVVMFALLYMQGFHHVDGLGDFGDAWMVMGNTRKKLEVMKDVYMGTGGLIFVFLIELISIFSIAYFYENLSFILFAKYIIIGETCSRLGLLSSACCGIPSKEGTGRHFVKNTKEFHLFIGYVLTLAVSVLMGVPKIGALCSTLAVFFGMFIAWNSNKSFKCVTGDILGATNEITRAIVLIAAIAFPLIY